MEDEAGAQLFFDEAEVSGSRVVVGVVVAVVSVWCVCLCVGVSGRVCLAVGCRPSSRRFWPLQQVSWPSGVFAR